MPRPFDPMERAYGYGQRRAEQRRRAQERLRQSVRAAAQEAPNLFGELSAEAILVDTLPEPDQDFLGRTFHIETSEAGEGNRVVEMQREGDGSYGWRDVLNEKGEWPVSHVASFGAAGTGNGQFGEIRGIAVDPTNGDVYVASDDRIQRFTSNGTYVSTVATLGSALGSVDAPAGLTFNRDGRLYVADTGNARIQIRQAAGTWDLFIDGYGAGDPRDVALTSDGAVLDATLPRYGVVIPVGDNGRIFAYRSPDEVVIDRDVNITVAAFGSGKGQVSSPYGVDVDAQGNLYVTDTGNHRVQVFDQNGIFQGLWGKAGTGDGEFDGPTAIAVTDDNLIYVADSGNFRVQIFRGPVVPVLSQVQVVTAQAGGVSNNSTVTWATHVTTTAVLPAGPWDVQVHYTVSMTSAIAATWIADARVGAPAVGTSGSAASAAAGRSSISRTLSTTVVSNGVAATTFRGEFKRNAGDTSGNITTENGSLIAVCRRTA